MLDLIPKIKIKFNKYIILIFAILHGNFLNINIVNGENNDSHNISKRMDLESCLGQFDIHRNMIIRTEESLAIGGKYLQGIALETVDECRRLCCETEFCDVFVFEEKSEEYCYLFECGRPENFRCKFTKHGNFTSAVLTPIRYITPPTTTTTTTKSPLPAPLPSSQIVHTIINPPVPSKQEIELKNLKQNKLDAQQVKKISITPMPISASATISSTIKTSTIRQTTTCGRFQFQCHSGECIGIYNACNGIPQCQDGSDEGPECSDLSNNNADNQKFNTNFNRIPSNIPNQIDDRTMHKSPETISGIQSLQSGMYQQQQQQQQQILQGSPILNREDTITGGATMMWPSRKIQTEQQLDLKPNSEIFRHKAGLQIPSNNMAPFSSQNLNSPLMYNGLPNQRGMYVPSDLQNSYRNGIVQPQDHIILPNMNWPQQQDQIQPIMPESIYSPVNMNIQQQQQQQQPQLQSPAVVKITQETIDPPTSVQIAPGNAGATDTQMKNENISSTIKKQNDGILTKNKDNLHKDSEDYVDYIETSTEIPKKKHKHKKITKDSQKETNKVDKEHKNPLTIAEVKMPIHEGYKMEMEFVDHDGYSERPGGAVLSLTLGVLVTAALAILIGCRLRTVGRRVRRLGKAPYGNDADFLVNGMYL